MEWRLVFYISCAFLVLTNMVYLLGASGKTQVWNTPASQKIAENGDVVSEEKKENQEKSEKN